MKKEKIIDIFVPFDDDKLIIKTRVLDIIEERIKQCNKIGTEAHLIVKINFERL